MGNQYYTKRRRIVANTIKQKRIECGYTISAFAKKMDAPLYSVFRWEKNECQPSPKYQAKLIKHLGKNIFTYNIPLRHDDI